MIPHIYTLFEFISIPYENQHQTLNLKKRDHPFYTLIPTHRPINSPFTTRLGYGGRILDLNPPPPGVLTGGGGGGVGAWTGTIKNPTKCLWQIRFRDYWITLLQPFAGFFNVPVLHRHGTTLFIRWFRHTAPFSRLLRHAWDTEDVFST